jgi:putative FmdB family regulatory protein
MPTYDYECSACANRFEAQQHMSDPPLTVCPQCGGPVRRVLSSHIGIAFKGAGFYRNDSRPAEGAPKGPPKPAEGAPKPADGAPKPADGTPKPTDGAPTPTDAAPATASSPACPAACPHCPASV